MPVTQSLRCSFDLAKMGFTRAASDTGYYAIGLIIASMLLVLIVGLVVYYRRVIYYPHLRWHEVRKPPESHEITNKKLATALQERKMGERLVILDKKEWKKIGIQRLHSHHYIKVPARGSGDSYFQPDASHLRWQDVGDTAPNGELSNKELKGALARFAKHGKANFTQEVWADFGIKDLHIDAFIWVENRCYKTQAARLPELTVRFVEDRSGWHQSAWQLEVWARQCVLFVLTAVSEGLQFIVPKRSHADGAYLTTVYAMVAPTVLVLLIFLYRHIRASPYHFVFQNVMEGALFASNIVLLVLACVYISVTEPWIEGVMVALVFGTLGAVVAFSVWDIKRTESRASGRLKKKYRNEILSRKLDDPVAELLRDGTIRLLECSWLLDDERLEAVLPRVTSITCQFVVKLNTPSNQEAEGETLISTRALVDTIGKQAEMNLAAFHPVVDREGGRQHKSKKLQEAFDDLDNDLKSLVPDTKDLEWLRDIVSDGLRSPLDELLKVLQESQTWIDDHNLQRHRPTSTAPPSAPPSPPSALEAAPIPKPPEFAQLAVLTVEDDVTPLAGAQRDGLHQELMAHVTVRLSRLMLVSETTLLPVYAAVKVHLPRATLSRLLEHPGNTVRKLLSLRVSFSPLVSPPAAQPASWPPLEMLPAPSPPASPPSGAQRGGRARSVSSGLWPSLPFGRIWPSLSFGRIWPSLPRSLRFSSTRPHHLNQENEQLARDVHATPLATEMGSAERRMNGQLHLATEVRDAGSSLRAALQHDPVQGTPLESVLKRVQAAITSAKRAGVTEHVTHHATEQLRKLVRDAIQERVVRVAEELDARTLSAAYEYVREVNQLVASCASELISRENGDAKARIHAQLQLANACLAVEQHLEAMTGKDDISREASDETLATSLRLLVESIRSATGASVADGVVEKAKDTCRKGEQLHRIRDTALKVAESLDVAELSAAQMELQSIITSETHPPLRSEAERANDRIHNLLQLARALSKANSQLPISLERSNVLQQRSQSLKPLLQQLQAAIDAATDVRVKEHVVTRATESMRRWLRDAIESELETVVEQLDAGLLDSAHGYVRAVNQQVVSYAPALRSEQAQRAEDRIEAQLKLAIEVCNANSALQPALQGNAALLESVLESVLKRVQATITSAKSVGVAEHVIRRAAEQLRKPVCDAIQERVVRVAEELDAGKLRAAYEYVHRVNEQVTSCASELSSNEAQHAEDQVEAQLRLLELLDELQRHQTQAMEEKPSKKKLVNLAPILNKLTSKLEQSTNKSLVRPSVVDKVKQAIGELVLADLQFTVVKVDADIEADKRCAKLSAAYDYLFAPQQPVRGGVEGAAASQRQRGQAAGDAQSLKQHLLHFAPGMYSANSQQERSEALSKIESRLNAQQRTRVLVPRFCR